MGELLKEIIDNYIDDQWDTSTLLDVLNNLDDVHLQVVMGHIMEVEEKHGVCKLRKVIENSTNLSVRTDHPNDTGITYDQSIYRRF